MIDKIFTRQHHGGSTDSDVVDGVHAAFSVVVL